MTFETIIIENPADGVALIRLNRPRQYNALNSQLLGELGQALEQFDQDDAIAAVVITGSDKAFAAGADIVEMLGKSGAEMSEMIEQVTGWRAISEFSKPTICAASGMALGGGFELALQCDVLMAAEGTKFALPEVNLGVIPGAGGTQRIVNAVGKSLAMEMVMSARPLFAEEALQKGIVSRVVALGSVEDEAINFAKKLAAKAPHAVRAAKRCVNKAVLTTLEEGLAYEREVFFPLFDTHDAKRLMNAFVNK